MNKTEFDNRFNAETSEEEFAIYNELYMDSEYDKDTFVAKVKRNSLIKRVARRAAQVIAFETGRLRCELDKAKRENVLLEHKLESKERRIKWGESSKDCCLEQLEYWRNRALEAEEKLKNIN